MKALRFANFAVSKRATTSSPLFVHLEKLKSTCAIFPLIYFANYYHIIKTEIILLIIYGKHNDILDSTLNSFKVNVCGTGIHESFVANQSYTYKENFIPTSCTITI